MPSKRVSVVTAKLYAAYMSMALAIGLTLAGCATVPRQSPKLVISFPALMSTASQKTVKWINPNGHPESMEFTEIAVPTPEQVQKYTEEYLRKVYAENYSTKLYSVRPLMVVLHSMAVGDLENGLLASGFLQEEVEYSISKWGRMPVGAHFIIARDGTIYCLAPAKNDAGKPSYLPGSQFPLKRHVSEANPWAIGIENIAPNHDDWLTLPDSAKAKIFSDLTEEQAEADAKLVRWLTSFAPSVRYVFSHDQFTSEQFRDTLQKDILPIPSNPNYVTVNRYDTGPDFLHKVKAKANSFGLHLRSDPH